MHALYYQMRTQKCKSDIVMNKYYQVVLKNIVSCEIKRNVSDKCRVCLRDGAIAIFGHDHTDTVVQILQQNNVNLSEDDKRPHLLCTVCFKFIQTTILFRETAKKAEEILELQIKNEENITDTIEDVHNNCSDDNITFEKESTDKLDIENKQDLKKIKRKVKCPLKATCHICKKVMNRSYYKEHMTMHDPDHKKFVCDVCGKSFRLRCAYHNHSLRHRTDFSFKCQFCPYRGRYLELLKTHMKTHTGDYRYMCTDCPARFLFKSNLNSHMLKHKEPTVKCDSCKRAFHTKLSLQRHFEAHHLGIKNHVCSVCGKAFGYRNAMMKHQRHVHKREKQLFGRKPAYMQANNDK